MPRPLPQLARRETGRYASTGLLANTNGHISGTVEAEAFQKGFARVLADIAQEKITTRTINTAADTEKYLSSIRPDLPDTTKKGSFTAANFNMLIPPPQN